MQALLEGLVTLADIALDGVNAELFCPQRRGVSVRLAHRLVPHVGSLDRVVFCLVVRHRHVIIFLRREGLLLLLDEQLVQLVGKVCPVTHKLLVLSGACLFGRR